MNKLLNIKFVNFEMTKYGNILIDLFEKVDQIDHRSSAIAKRYVVS